MSAGCSSASAINQNLFNRGAARGQPSIWLNGDKDLFYPPSHSRAAFEAASGKGAFHEYEPPLWSGVLEAYLVARGLPAKPPPRRLATRRTRPTSIEDVEAAQGGSTWKHPSRSAFRAAIPARR